MVIGALIGCVVTCLTSIGKPFDLETVLIGMTVGGGLGWLVGLG